MFKYLRCQFSVFVEAPVESLKLDCDYVQSLQSDRHRPIFLVAAFDSNHDESLDESEVPPKMWHHLGNAGADRDGIVSTSEFQVARVQSQQ